MDGTIRGRESKKVVMDLLARRRVPCGVWSLSPRGVLTLLIGSRAVTFDCGAGKSFYGLQSLLQRIDDAITEMEAARANRQQIDLEECIQSASAA